MSKKLGIYLDASAVGWTLYETDRKKILGMGVHRFNPDCENFGWGKREQSKKKSKRNYRLHRIRHARIRSRKYYLLRILAQHNMCPVALESLKQWKQKKHFPHDELDQWLSMNPYALRKKGVSDKLSLNELGRILYQITQRRGYRFGERHSRLKGSVLYKGSQEDGKIGYEQTQRSVKENTLGEYLFQLLPRENKSYTHQLERVRNRICSTQMYFDEIHKIWEIQSRFYHFQEGLRERLIGNPNDRTPKGAVFFLRRLKSQKHKVGNCSLEPNKTRACVSSFECQEVEAWKWINSIQYNNQPLEEEERRVTFAFLRSNYKFKFSDLKNRLQLPDKKAFNYRDDEIFKGIFIDYEMSKNKFFGTDWFNMDSKLKEDVFHALYFFDDLEKLKQHAEEKFGLDEYCAEQFSKISLDKTYALLSKKACRNLLPFLRQGYRYKTAVFLGGIKNAIAPHWETLSAENKAEIATAALKIKKENSTKEVLSKLQSWFDASCPELQFKSKKVYGIPPKKRDKNLEKYFEVSKETDKLIHKLDKNIVIQSVFELRKVLNALLKKYGSISSINCELSVDLKVNRMQRFIYKIDQKRIKGNRDRYFNIIKKLGVNLTPMNILKYDLFEECKKVCPFTNKPIPIASLFTQEIRIVYINPWEFSLNDSHLNKVLCFAEVAEELEGRTPHEYFMNTQMENWGEIKKRLMYQFSNTRQHPASFTKFQRFVKKYNKRNIIQQQFNDPHIISRSLESVLSIVFQEVNISMGNTTQHLIEQWLLLNSYKEKSKALDYRQSAMRSFVNAVKTTEHLESLKQRNKYKWPQNKTSFPRPYNNYFEDFTKHFNEILVSYKSQKRILSTRKKWIKKEDIKVFSNNVSVRGMLHKESFYGKRTSPNKVTALHIRKPLNQIKSINQVDKIVDPVVKKLVQEAVIKNFDGKQQIPPNTFFKKDKAGRVKPKLFLPNTKGDPVPIKKVRIREAFNTEVKLKAHKNQFVIPRNNHHVLIYEDIAGQLHEDVVSFWEVVQRMTKGKPIVEVPQPEQNALITVLKTNDLFLMGADRLEENIALESNAYLMKILYRVQKLSSKYYEFRLAYKPTSNSTEFPDYIRINNFGDKKTGWFNYNPIKVEVDCIGQIKKTDYALEKNRFFA